MKLSVTLLVLGIIILLAACYITGWMDFEAQSQFIQPPADTCNNVLDVHIVQSNEALLHIARYGSYALPVLGVLVLVIAAIQSVKVGARTRRLITINIIAGILVTGLSSIITGWQHSTTTYTGILECNGQFVTFDTVPDVPLLDMLVVGMTLLLGLAIVGAGITQLIKARKTVNT
jgi:hypothetical protein